MEEDEYDAHGQYLATSLSTYKIPSIRELPETFDAELVELTRKHTSILGSKAIGEPPFIYGEAAYFAIKHAIESAKNHQVPANLNMPATPEAILQAIENLES
jgi:xanthine dehydrogenase large subunit